MAIPKNPSFHHVTAFLGQRDMMLVRESDSYWYVASKKGRRLLRITVRAHPYTEPTPQLDFHVNSAASSKEFPMTRPAQERFADTRDAFDWLDELVQRFATVVGDYTARIRCGITDTNTFIERGYTRASTRHHMVDRYVQHTEKEL